MDYFLEINLNMNINGNFGLILKADFSPKVFQM